MKIYKLKRKTEGYYEWLVVNNKKLYSHNYLINIEKHSLIFDDFWLKGWLGYYSEVSTKEQKLMNLLYDVENKITKRENKGKYK